MKVYLTYDRYERNEWLSVHRIETNKARAVKFFKEKDLPDFLAYGPDDCHSFQLQKVEMSKEMYLTLCKWVEAEGSHSETNYALKNLLISIYEEDGDFEVETIYSTDGCSDNFELLRFYADMYHLDYDEMEDEIQERLCNNEELYMKVLKEYIRCNY